MGEYLDYKRYNMQSWFEYCPFSAEFKAADTPQIPQDIALSCLSTATIGTCIFTLDKPLSPLFPAEEYGGAKWQYYAGDTCFGHYPGKIACFGGLSYSTTRGKVRS
jgi:hypothetical protein